MARERAKSMDHKVVLEVVHGGKRQRKLCRPTMASSQPGRMLAFPSVQASIWGMSVRGGMVR